MVTAGLMQECAQGHFGRNKALKRQFFNGFSASVCKNRAMRILINFVDSEGIMPDYYVTLEAAWLVKDVKSVDDAIGIAISEAGKRLNPKLSKVEVAVGSMSCPACGEIFDSVYLVAKTALVGLILEIKILNAETESHAAKIAKAVIGKALADVPLKAIDVALKED